MFHEISLKSWAISACAFCVLMGHSVANSQTQSSQPTLPGVQESRSLTEIPAISESAPKPNMDPNADLMLQYGSEASVYRALTKKLEAQLQAINRQTEIEKAAPHLKRAPGPVLIAVEGFTSRGLKAFIELVPGATIEAREGVRLPNGMTVERIGFDNVVLRSPNGKREVVLGVPQFNDSGKTVGKFMTSEEVKAAAESVEVNER